MTTPVGYTSILFPDPSINAVVGILATRGVTIRNHGGRYIAENVEIPAGPKPLTPRPLILRNPAAVAAGLTEREVEVLEGMRAGKSNGQIGLHLFLSEDTVKTHGRRLFQKLGVKDRAHAVDAGWRRGILTASPQQ